MRLLELDRRDVAERLMQAVVVEPAGVFDDREDEPDEALLDEPDAEDELGEDALDEEPDSEPVPADEPEQDALTAREDQGLTAYLGIYRTPDLAERELRRDREDGTAPARIAEWRRCGGMIL